MKVYCSKCKFNRQYRIGIQGGCEHPSNIATYDGAIRPYKAEKEAREIKNCQNNCPDYKEASVLRKILRAL